MGCSRTFFIFIAFWTLSRSFLVGLFGLAIGVWLDQWDAERLSRRRRERMEHVRSTFLLCMMGAFAKIAKADGRVSESEIETISRMFDEWGLTPDDVRVAQRVFREARDDDVLFITYVRQFADDCRQLEFRLIFLQCLVRLASAEGGITPEQMRMLSQAGAILNLPPGTLHMLISGFAREHDFHGRHQHRSHTGGPQATTPTDDDYAAIGVAASATDAEIKKAYRRKAMDLHPDRIQARGLPPEFIRVANDQLAMVNAAYDRIRKSRGIQ